MSILSSLLEKILPKSRAAQSQAQGAPASTPTPMATPPQQVDVDEILRGVETKSGQKLDWRHSIVDLMKMVGMDSDLASRKELAKELKYTGDTNDSATMNIWLHKQVMKKLEENGGKIPEDMKH